MILIIRTKINKFFQLMSFCFQRFDSCFDPVVTCDVCFASSLRIVKTIRVFNYTDLDILLKDPELANMKILALYRDPRAMSVSGWLGRYRKENIIEVCNRYGDLVT